MKKVLLITLACFLIAVLQAVTVRYEYSFENPNIETNDGFSQIKFDNTNQIANIGEPSLPYRGVKILLPVGEEAESITLKMENPVTISKNLMLYPGQNHYPLSYEGQTAWVNPKDEIYNSNEIYPVENYKNLSTHFYSGYPIAFAAITPVEYNPSSKLITYYQKIIVEVQTTSTSRSTQSTNLLKNNHYVSSKLRNFIDNSSDILLQGNNRNDNYDYLMIIDEDKESQWQPLVDFHENRGLEIKIAAVQDIDEQVTGIDLQDKIRNYIISEYEEYSIKYVLLAGDTDVIPHRGMWVSMGGDSYTDDDIPADMYYSCLDGNWNYDEDELWGEPNEADLIPELAIGRICYNSDQEIANMIHKITTYHNEPVEDEIKSVLFIGEWLWDGPTWGGDYMDEMIGSSSMNGHSTIGVPETWDISTLYDRENGGADSWGPYDLYPLLSNGPNLINHLGHSATTYNMRLSNNNITNTNIQNDGDDENYSIIFTQGCYAGSFDNRLTNPSYTSDCIAEKFTSIENAAVAMIANSRYGWGQEGSTDGASQKLHREYIDAMFGESIMILGDALVDGKVDIIPFITESVMYWVDYQTNLLGDPALMVWTDEPQEISAGIPDVWSLDNLFYQVSTNTPDALVSIKLDGDLIWSGQTDENGNVNIILAEQLLMLEYDLYITAPNHYPFNASFTPDPSQTAYVTCTAIQFDNDDNHIESGDEIIFDVNLNNMGLQAVSNGLYLTINSDQAYIDFVQDSLYIGSIDSGEALSLENAFTAVIGNGFEDLEEAHFVVTTHYADVENSFYSSITLNAPIINLESYFANHEDILLNPGDDVEIYFTAENVGSASANNVNVYLMTSSPYVTINTPETNIGSIAVESMGMVTSPLLIQVSEDCPTNEQLILDYMIFGDNGSGAFGSIMLSVGVMSYTFEPGLPVWEHESLSYGFVDEWHVSDNRNYTDNGSQCVKYGGVGSQDYSGSGHGGLVTPEITVGEGGFMKFYHWMDAEIDNGSVAWDGGNVEISVNGGDFELLYPEEGYQYTSHANDDSPFPTGTPIFSGTHDWEEVVFDLNGYEGNVQFRFVFGSDGFVSGEGWYIDDMSIGGFTGQADEVAVPMLSTNLSGNYPNPFNPETRIEYITGEKALTNLEIFNIKGQKVKTLVNEIENQGQHHVIWNGTDNENKPVSSGVYFYKLRNGRYTSTKKMLLLK